MEAFKNSEIKITTFMELASLQRIIDGNTAEPADAKMPWVKNLDLALGMGVAVEGLVHKVSLNLSKGRIDGVAFKLYGAEAEVHCKLLTSEMQDGQLKYRHYRALQKAERERETVEVAGRLAKKNRSVKGPPHTMLCINVDNITIRDVLRR